HTIRVGCERGVHTPGSIAKVFKVFHAIFCRRIPLTSMVFHSKSFHKVCRDVEVCPIRNVSNERNRFKGYTQSMAAHGDEPGINASAQGNENLVMAGGNRLKASVN